MLGKWERWNGNSVLAADSATDGCDQQNGTDEGSNAAADAGANLQRLDRER
jgi:hypothetical protein